MVGRRRRRDRLRVRLHLRRARRRRVTLVEARDRLLAFLDARDRATLLATPDGRALGIDARCCERASTARRRATGERRCRLAWRRRRARRPTRALRRRAQRQHRRASASSASASRPTSAATRGRRALPRPACPGVYAAGDVIGFPALASMSMEQARVARVPRLRLRLQAAPWLELLPYGIYTIPEVSMRRRDRGELRGEGHRLRGRPRRATRTTRAARSSATSTAW